jgi:hypothetical protein
MDDDFPIEDSAIEAELQVWLAEQYLAASARINDELARILPAAQATADGMDHALIRQAVGAFKVEAEALSARVWPHIEQLSELDANCINRAFQTLHTFSMDTEGKIAGRVFESYNPMRNWDNPVIRSIRQRFLELGKADWDRSHENYERVERNASSVAEQEVATVQRQWLENYTGINGKVAWPKFREAFPFAKKASFEALFVEVKGQRLRGRPARKTTQGAA